MKKNTFVRVHTARRFYALTLLVILSIIGTMPLTAEAATTIRVDTHLDSNSLWQCTPAPTDCSLRGAIRNVQENNLTDALIVLPANHYRLQLGQLVIRRSLSIRGEHADTTVIDALEKWRVILIEGASTPTIQIANVTIENGKVESQKGGGIRIEEGAILILARSVVRNNLTVNVHQQPGGGIFNAGQLRIIESTITNNAVPTDFDDGAPEPSGGGIHNAAGAQLLIERSTIFENIASFGGGISNWGNMTIVNTTISGNDASIQGGGIWNAGTGTILFSTITQNERKDFPNAGSSRQSGGGGIYNGDPEYPYPGTLSMGSTILVDNFPGFGRECLSSHPASQFTSLGGNLIGLLGVECNMVRQNSDQIGGSIDPKLASLGYYGGPTLTHALRSRSPAIDQGINGDCPRTDQRGLVRPLDGDGDKRARCDVGAFEANFVPVDDFAFGEHPGGRLGDNWGGDKSIDKYFVSTDGRLDVEAGGAVYWTANNFGTDQHVFITLVNIAPQGVQRLLLKVQGIWQQGAIRVFYDAPAQRLGIESKVPPQDWVSLKTIPRVLRNGDQLGARARSNGTVSVYLNGIEIANANAGSFFVNRGGRVGLWFSDAPSAILDDFVGATIP